jgi:hypothetical protein
MQLSVRLRRNNPSAWKKDKRGGMAGTEGRKVRF